MDDIIDGYRQYSLLTSIRRQLLCSLRKNMFVKICAIPVNYYMSLSVDSVIISSGLLWIEN